VRQSAARAASRRNGCPSARISWRVQTVAAVGLVLATSFGLLMISPLIADIGFAVAAGVLLLAFINAFLLVPALTVLAGKAAWWPSHPRTPAHAGRPTASRPSSLDAATPWN
jgi:putative drug exporter of the RND superfamily